MNGIVGSVISEMKLPAAGRVLRKEAPRGFVDLLLSQLIGGSGQKKNLTEPLPAGGEWGRPVEAEKDYGKNDRKMSRLDPVENFIAGSQPVSDRGAELDGIQESSAAPHSVEKFNHQGRAVDILSRVGSGDTGKMAAPALAGTPGLNGSTDRKSVV